MNKKLYFLKNTVFLFGTILWEIHNIIYLTPLGDRLNGESRFLRLASLIIILSTVFLIDNYEIKPVRQIAFLVILLFLLFNNYIISKNPDWLDFVIIIVASIGIDFNFFLKRFIWFSIAIYLLVMLSSKINIIPNIIAGVGSSRVRESLGFSWSSFAPHELVTIFAGLVWIYQEKINNLTLALIVMVNIYLYVKTDTRSPFLLILLFIFLYFIINKTQIFNSFGAVTKILLQLLPWLLIFGIYYLSAHAIEFPQLDKMFSTRLTLGFQGLEMYPVQLLGRYLPFADSGSIINQYFTIDSSFLRYLLNFGWISSVIFSFAYSLLMKRLAALGNKYYVFAIVLILVNGFTDPWILNFGYNPFMVLFGGLFFSGVLSSINQEQNVNVKK